MSAKIDLDLQDGQSLELLKELHILTRDGKINLDSRRKLKQVKHLFQFIKPILEEIYQKKDSVTLVDHGAGKSYLGFIIYDLFLKNKANGHIYGTEFRKDLVLKSKELAQKLGFDRMSFLDISVQEANSSELIPAQIDIITALHACDTATDDAIQFGLKKNAEYFVLVPCCQAEVASILRKVKSDSIKHQPLAELWRHPIHTREIGSHLTNVLRCLLLESKGYKVTVTELIGWEHSMKNELIIAQRTGQRNNRSLNRLNELVSEFNLTEWLSKHDVLT